MIGLKNSGSWLLKLTVSGLAFQLSVVLWDLPQSMHLFIPIYLTDLPYMTNYIYLLRTTLSLHFSVDAFKERLGLVFKGSLLENDKTLAESGIIQGSEIRMIMQISG